MSHVCTVDVEVKDLDALAAAAHRVGLELVRGQQTYRCWYTNIQPEQRESELARYRFKLEDLVPKGFSPEDIGRCDHAIRVPGSDREYEIGIAQRRDGRPGFTLLMEDMGEYGHLGELIGPGGVRLKREYAAVVAVRQAQRAGFLVNEVRNSDGSIRLVLNK